MQNRIFRRLCVRKIMWREVLIRGKFLISSLDGLWESVFLTTAQVLLMLSCLRKIKWKGEKWEKFSGWRKVGKAWRWCRRALLKESSSLDSSYPRNISLAGLIKTVTFQKAGVWEGMEATISGFCLFILCNFSKLSSDIFLNISRFTLPTTPLGVLGFHFSSISCKMVSEIPFWGNREFANFETALILWTDAMRAPNSFEDENDVWRPQMVNKDEK